MNVNNWKGDALRATASIETIDGVTGVVLESRGGKEGSPNERNIDYLPALDAILLRLSKFPDATTTIYLVSTRAMKIWATMNDRSIGKVIFISRSMREIQSIRYDITSRIQNKKEDPKSIGGCPTKRILIAPNLSKDKLQYLITGKI